MTKTKFGISQRNALGQASEWGKTQFPEMFILWFIMSKQ